LPNARRDKKILVEHKKSEIEKEYHNGKINMVALDETQRTSHKVQLNELRQKRIE